MPGARGNAGSPPSARLPSSGGASSSGTQAQPDALSLLFDVSSHSSPNSSSQHLFGPSPSQVGQYPQPPPTPPLQNSAPAQQAGARLFPLPAPSSSLPASLGAIPPLSYYQQIWATIPAQSIVPIPTKKNPCELRIGKRWIRHSETSFAGTVVRSGCVVVLWRVVVACIRHACRIRRRHEPLRPGRGGRILPAANRTWGLRRSGRVGAKDQGSATSEQAVCQRTLLTTANALLRR